MSKRHIKGGTAIYIATVPASFRPQRLWDVTPEILTARLHSKNLAMSVALGFARAHNLAQVQALEHGRRPIESWAIVVRHLSRIGNAAGSQTLCQSVRQEGGAP